MNLLFLHHKKHKIQNIDIVNEKKKFISLAIFYTFTALNRNKTKRLDSQKFLFFLNAYVFLFDNVFLKFLKLLK